MFEYIVQVCRYIEDEYRYQLCSFTNGRMALHFAREVQSMPEVVNVVVAVNKNED